MENYIYQTKSAVFLKFVVFEFDPSHHQPTNFTVYSIIPQNAGEKKNMLEVAPTVAFFPLLLLAGHPGAKPEFEETLL